jgi:dethiobiotin synthetase
MVDLIKKLRLPVVLVSSTRLGTINHTLLSLEALASRQIPLFGVIFVGEPLEFSEEVFTQQRHPLMHRIDPPKVLGRVPKTLAFSKDWFMSTYQSLFERGSNVESIFGISPSNSP